MDKKWHDIVIKDNCLKLDDLPLRGLLGYNLDCQVDQNTGVTESILNLKLIVGRVDAQSGKI